MMHGMDEVRQLHQATYKYRWNIHHDFFDTKDCLAGLTRVHVTYNEYPVQSSEVRALTNASVDDWWKGIILRKEIEEYYVAGY